jgi:hypothetical protein
MNRELYIRAVALLGLIALGCYQTAPSTECWREGCGTDSGPVRETGNTAGAGDTSEGESDDTTIDIDTGPYLESDPPAGFDTAGCDGSGPAYEGDWIGHFEDGTLRAAQPEYRGFFAYSDGTSTMIPRVTEEIVQPATTGVTACSSMVMHLKSDAPFLDWGAGVRVRWGPETDGVPATVDLTGYRGIRFRILRRSGATGIRFSFPDPHSNPAFGFCDEEGGQWESCYGEWYTLILIDSAGVWETREILFEGLQRAAWGYGTDAFLQDQCIGLKIQISQGPDFDLYLDDIYFIR